MKSYYSLIRFVNNPLSGENITVGLIVLSDSDIYFKFSPSKISFVSKINPSQFKLFEYTIDKIKSFLQRESEYNSQLFRKDISESKEYLNRLSIYNNGFIQFDEPRGVDIKFDEIRFDSFFKKYIELEIKIGTKKTIDRSFKSKIKSVFWNPLKAYIDIDAKIRKEQIPGLFFDYKLDGIGMKDVVYSVKSIDLNAEPAIYNIQKDISEFETLSYRVNSLTKEREDLFYNVGIRKENQHFLVMDEYKGMKSPLGKLYETLSETNYPLPYKIINSNELGALTEQLLSSGATKFMDKI